jgi:hypothetical protein
MGLQVSYAQIREQTELTLSLENGLSSPLSFAKCQSRLVTNSPSLVPAKWMSGHAATALVLKSDRGQFRTLAIRSLGEPIPPNQGESPFPLDFYLHGRPRVSEASGKQRQQFTEHLAEERPFRAGGS